MSLYLYVRSEKEKNSKKEEKKRDYVVCDLIIETKQFTYTEWCSFVLIQAQINYCFLTLL